MTPQREEDGGVVGGAREAALVVLERGAVHGVALRRVEHLVDGVVGERVLEGVAAAALLEEAALGQGVEPVADVDGGARDARAVEGVLEGLDLLAIEVGAERGAEAEERGQLGGERVEAARGEPLPGRGGRQGVVELGGGEMRRTIPIQGRWRTTPARAQRPRTSSERLERVAARPGRQAG